MIVQIAPLPLLLLAWEWAVSGDPQKAFFFGAPSQIFSYLFSGIVDGSLLFDIYITTLETVLGFVIGNLIGISFGLGLWASKRVFEVVKPYIIALGSAPVFALAPVLIIWFGTGLASKVAIATISTVFVALLQAYRGAQQVDDRQIRLLQSFGATKSQIFKKIIVPSSMVWVISAFKLNIGFALLGAFIGEYISSERGLGHLILVAGGLYNVSLLFVGVFLLIMIALGLDALVGAIELPLRKWIVRIL